ncbi:stage V sporulation protein AB [Jeotgalibacillus proteolyticus]|uniref:Stage V sporulation protein AB n=1 Tax=Jeotgalibacillus proteolyticus TaxID=2082395 RepID=A0A2S5GE33_9BACL|nr:stage V sporulation protein AB [Jeotgalibacillus proteolyticus]PPA71307.1 stage V sporulation protein AB [Jeotgalibacillus proteolyticus]
MISSPMVVFVGLASGLAVGGGFVAFLSVLGIIPRLIQIVQNKNRLRPLEWAVILGAMTGVAGSLFDVKTSSGFFLVPAAGLLAGAFIGMLAAALTEVLDVIPLVTRRLKIADKLQSIMFAIVIGKVMGSLFYWIIFIPFHRGD